MKPLTHKLLTLGLSSSLLTLGVSSAYAEEEPATAGIEELQGITIRGNDELPLGLYIMPWKEPEPVEIETAPTQLLTHELKPIDPTVFERELQYYNAFAK